ncbi:MAG TPA: tail fiber protein [Magnetospirillum sp.]|nr:tail fiber protein [Magnetospirillum sp.]
MTEHIQIKDLAPTIQYAANGAQTAFTFPFAVFKEADLEVWLGTTQVHGGFILSGIGDSSGGKVVFTVPPQDGERVILRRRMALERYTDFQTDGVIRAKSLNDELDYQVAAVQQLADDLSRCVQRPFTSTSRASLMLPEPVGGRALKWSTSGSGLVNSTQDVDHIAAIAADHAAAAEESRRAADADRAATAADRATVRSDRLQATDAAAATAADREAVAIDRAAVTTLNSRAQTAAALAEAAADSLGSRLVGESTSNLSLTLGLKTLSAGRGKAWVAGMSVVIVDAGQPLRNMTGTVVEYDQASGQLQVQVEDVQGAGSGTYWTVLISGRRGAPGAGSGDMRAENALGEIGARGAAAVQMARDNLGLAAVAVTGAYNDLAGTPDLGSAAAAMLGTQAGQVPTAEQIPVLVNSVPTGSVTAYVASVAPTGWLMCNGAEVSRLAYPKLFALIGVRFGEGDGVNTFNVPDLRGRTPIGAGQGTGLTARPLAAKVGAETHTLAVSETPAHSHNYTVYMPGEIGTYVYGVSRGDSPKALATTAVGGGEAHNNMQPSLAINFIIKT